MPGLDWAIFSGYVVTVIALIISTIYSAYKACKGGAS